MKRSGPLRTVSAGLLILLSLTGLGLILAGRAASPPADYISPGPALRGLLSPLSFPAARLAAHWRHLPAAVYGVIAILFLWLTLRLLKGRGKLPFTAGMLSAAAAVWAALAAAVLAAGTPLPAPGNTLFIKSVGSLLLLPAAGIYYGFHRLFGGLLWISPALPAALAGILLIKKSRRRKALLFWTLSLSLEAILLFLTLSFLFPGESTPAVTAFFRGLTPKVLYGLLFPGALILWSFFLARRLTGFTLRRKNTAPGKKPETRPRRSRKPDLDLSVLPEDKVPPEPETPQGGNSPGEDMPGPTEEVSTLIEQTTEIFHRLSLPLAFSRAACGPAAILLEYRVPEDLSLSEVKRKEGEIAFRLTGEKGQPLIPIPGKEGVGVILPRKQRLPLNIKAQVPLLYRTEAQLPVYLGRTISGDDFITDLAAAPHLMVAGSTGSGKSVFLHSLIESLTSGPRRRFTRLILVDPKRVEFGRFSSCPGLAYPVVEEADDLAALLSQLTDIMEERYRYLSKKKVRDLGELHRKEDEPGMPYLAVVIDEVADIFLSERGKEIKTSIIRLAQKSRAVGIHLVLATQRPSADIVDGLIKANFPTRIAFRTSSQVDSRVILDRGGAETLFGKGDGLFVSPEREYPVRFQGAFSG